MRTTVTIDDELMDEAMAATGRADRAGLIRDGLRALIAVEAGRRLAALGGTDPGARPAPRGRDPRAS